MTDWYESEQKIYEKAYSSGRGDLLYIEDSFDQQPELSDFKQGRYKLKFKHFYRPSTTTLETSHSFEQLEQMLESKTSGNDPRTT